MVQWNRTTVQGHQDGHAVFLRNPEHPIKGFASNGLPLFGVHVLPGTIAAANYDQFPLSGEGHTYHDLSPGNAGAQYRTGDVDIGSGRDGRPVLTNLEPTEWLTYTLHVRKAGAYRIEARYSATAADGALRFAFGAAAATEAIALPSTEGTSVTHTLASGVVLRVGVEAMRVFVAGAPRALELESLSVQAE